VVDTLAVVVVGTSVEAVHRPVAVADTFAAEAVGTTVVVADILAVVHRLAVEHRLVVLVVVVADTSVEVH
jgi:hypothetical protein